MLRRFYFSHIQLKAIPTNIQEKSTWVANNAKNAATRKAEVAHSSQSALCAPHTVQ